MKFSNKTCRVKHDFGLRELEEEFSYNHTSTKRGSHSHNKCEVYKKNPGKLPKNAKNPNPKDLNG